MLEEDRKDLVAFVRVEGDGDGHREVRVVAVGQFRLQFGDVERQPAAEVHRGHLVFTEDGEPAGPLDGVVRLRVEGDGDVAVRGRPVVVDARVLDDLRERGADRVPVRDEIFNSFLEFRHA